ncbi:hypothetical protein BGZ98_003584, partial [Dissophora globulifera]
MENTQPFRLAGTTEIQNIPIQYVDGQSVVYWDSIEQAFPGARQVKNGNLGIPRCIKAFPGVVLDVVLSSAMAHFDVDSSAETPSVIPTVTLAPALTVGLTDAPTNHPTDLPSESEDKFIRALRVTPALAETPISDDRANTLSTGTLLALEKANKSDSQVQLQEISANMTQMIKLQNASDAKQEEIKQLQNQALEQQEEMMRLQNQALEHQEEMKRLQKQALEGQEKMDRLQNEMKQLQIQNQEEI